jgi:predicted nucleic acid-binding Zn ribbon protein
MVDGKSMRKATLQDYKRRILQVFAQRCGDSILRELRLKANSAVFLAGRIRDK